jgi:hypothetical protein
MGVHQLMFSVPSFLSEIVHFIGAETYQSSLKCRPDFQIGRDFREKVADAKKNPYIILLISIYKYNITSSYLRQIYFYEYNQP